MADRHPMVGKSSRRKPCCGFEFDEEIDTDDWKFVSDTAKVSASDFPEKVCKDLLRAIQYRDQIYGARPVPDDATVDLGPVPDSIFEAMEFMRKLDANPATRAFCRTRLDLLEAAFTIYKLENQDEELTEIEANAACFDAIPKVDTHLHASAVMSAPVLARKITEICYNEADRECGDKTVGAIFKEAGYEIPDTSGGQPDIRQSISVDALKVQGGYKMFKDFSKFNAAFSPMGCRSVKDLLFGYTTLEGEYLASILEDCASKAQEHNVHLEPRFSIYGRKKGEWAVLAKWARRWGVPEISGILIGIQLPRIYSVWRKKGMVSSFGEMLTNFWGDALEAACNPEAEGNEDIAWFLTHVRVIDTVDDESKVDNYSIEGLPAPNDWTSTDNPPYAYYHYYMQVNLQKLNAFRKLNLAAPEIVLRPHCGEAGPPHHLITTFLMAQGISHGMNLMKTAVMQYLYYLVQIPVGMSPISNATLFCKYRDNPFPFFFQRGLNVCLTTDDPMMFHITDEPLMEEYACARTCFDLDTVDLCEIARNSVEAAFSERERYELHGEDGWDPDKTNIPKRRMLYRYKKHQEERRRMEAAGDNMGNIKAQIHHIFHQACGATCVGKMKISSGEFKSMMKHLNCELDDSQLNDLHAQLLLVQGEIADSHAEDTVDLQVLLDYLLSTS